MTMIMYKDKYYHYNYNNNFNDFMNTEIFRVLVKDIRESKKKDNLKITIERDTEPLYWFGKFCGYQCNGEYLTINNEEVINIPSYAIHGLMQYVDKYVGLSI